MILSGSSMTRFSFRQVCWTRWQKTIRHSLRLYAALWHRGLIEVQAVSRSEQLPEATRLHIGEAQAIQLARELALPLLIEETVGRRVARGLGISLSGVAGQILKAFRQGSLTAQEARDKLLELLQAGGLTGKSTRRFWLPYPEPNTCPEGGCQGVFTVFQDPCARWWISDEPRELSACR